MVDRTGPVMVSLWDAAAHQLSRVVHNAPKGSRPLLLLQKVRITLMAQNDWNGTCVTSMKILGSVATGEAGEGTTIQRLSSPLSPYNQSHMHYVCPKPPAAVIDFHQLRDHRLPFRGTFIGCVQNLAPIDATGNGTYRRDFDLVDDAGRSFGCSVIGLQAKSTKLNDDAKVVLYHGVARRAGQTDTFVVYIFRDGFIANIGTVSPSPRIHEKVTTNTVDA